MGKETVYFKERVVYIDQIDRRNNLLKPNETSEVSATFYHHRKFRKFLKKKFHVQDIIIALILFQNHLF